MAEDPTELMTTLKNMVANEQHSPEQRVAVATQKREEALTNVKDVLDELEWWQFRYRLWFAQRYYPLRDETTFYLGCCWPALRSMAAELGKRLAAVGSLDGADDIYYLKGTELEDALAAQAKGRSVANLVALTHDRRELRAARKRLRAPNMLPEKARKMRNQRVNPTFKENDPDSETMSGFGVSGGVITGRVSLIGSPEQFGKMAPGTILVCHTTSPAWTHLFPKAIGLITDIGSIGAHGALVAREYGIPAVLGVGTGTDRIEHGQEVTIDGDAGVVTLGAKSAFDV